MIRAIIVDDEHLAQDLILNFLKEDSEIEVVAMCSNGFEGLKAIQELHPDLVFLDVMMPKITGFEMLELLDDPPHIIFSTAHDQFAVQAFELNAIDYLLKPYSKTRFVEAVTKVKGRIRSDGVTPIGYHSLAEKRAEQQHLDRIVVKVGSRIHVIPASELQYLEAMDDYVNLYSMNGKFIKQATMKFFEKGLPKEEFVRVHRSYLVAIREILKLEPMSKDTHVCVLKDGTQLAVSRSGYSRLKEVLNF